MCLYVYVFIFMYMYMCLYVYFTWQIPKWYLLFDKCLCYIDARSTVNFTGALQTEHVRSPPFKHLELHSPTRSVYLEAPETIQINTKGGDIAVQSKFAASFASEVVSWIQLLTEFTAPKKIRYNVHFIAPKMRCNVNFAWMNCDWIPFRKAKHIFWLSSCEMYRKFVNGL